MTNRSVGNASRKLLILDGHALAFHSWFTSYPNEVFHGFFTMLEDSVEGHIQFNAETLYHGTVFNDIRLEFEKGKIVKATGSDDEKINSILDSDEGSRYIGEFAIAFNPHITEPMKDILFDEKIAGSFHFTPGNAYDIADNGNRSDVH